jgi:hypothetical protein
MLKKIAARVQAGGDKAFVTFYDSADRGQRDFEITEEDIRWAKDVEKIVDLAYDAGQQSRFEE